MKLNGLVGLGTGKLGQSVFSVNAGTQIVRQYQPIVANPSTETQVGQRAKFKLMSQLAAAMAPVIAIPKAGMLTPRNQFIKLNFQGMEEDAGTAQADLAMLKITKSSLPMVGLSASWRSSGYVTLQLASAAPSNITSVAYAIFKRSEDDKLSLVKEEVVNTPGQDRLFVVDPLVGDGDLMIYGYGIIADSAEGAARYAAYNVTSAGYLATLIATRRLTANDIKVTDTVATALDAQS